MALIYNVDWGVMDTRYVCHHVYCAKPAHMAMYLDCVDGCCRDFHVACADHMWAFLDRAVEYPYLEWGEYREQLSDYRTIL